MQCIICDSRNVEEYRPAEIDHLGDVSFSYSFSPAHNRTFRVVRCRDCTHLFCSPLPQDIEASYRDVVDREYLKHAESRQRSADAVLGTIERHVGGRRLLDVGCATGDMLEAARARGFEPEGLELSTWSATIARERGFVVHQTPLAEFADSCGPRFDVVSFIGVIEHFRDPRTEIRNVARVVAPGGLVALWTGDAAAWLPRLLGHRWWWWQGQHIQYFTRRSLTILVEAAGFERLATETYPFAATLPTLSNSLRRYPLHQLVSAALKPIFLLRPVFYLRLPGEMLFLARRH